MINECVVIYDNQDVPKMEVLRRYKDSPQDDTSILSQLKYLDTKKKLKDLAYEQLYVMSFNINGKLKAFMCVGSGDYDHCDVFFRNIGMFLLLSGAEKACIVHNHPEDVREQSDDDIDLTDKFDSICKIFNIKSNGSYIFTRSGITQIPHEFFYDWRLIK